MSRILLSHAIVDDLRLASRFSDNEARQVRRRLEQHAQPASTRQYFADGDALRTAALVFDKAVDVGVDAFSVANAIELAEKRAIAVDLRAHLSRVTKDDVASSDIAVEGADNSCVVCFDRPRQGTMQCGHANLCLECGTKVNRCPTCMAPKELFIKLYQD